MNWKRWRALVALVGVVMGICSARAASAEAAKDPANLTSTIAPANAPFTDVLYGAAYYHEYMPYERLDKDVALMKSAGGRVHSQSLSRQARVAL